MRILQRQTVQTITKIIIIHVDMRQINVKKKKKLTSRVKDPEIENRLNNYIQFY